MKARVTKLYKDKNTGLIHRVGDVVTLTDDRFKEINDHAKGPFLDALKKKPAAKPVASKPEPKKEA